MQDQVLGYAEAQRALQKYLTPRAKALQGLESYVEGTQYAGLPDWFSDKKPLWERAPCIVYPIVKSAIDSNGDLLLGEGRFPDCRVDGLSGDDAEGFEQAISRVVQQSRLKAAAREVFAAGQGCGSACAIFGVRGGRLFIDTVLARWCEPVLDDEGVVQSLEIRYPYLVIEKTNNGPTWVCKIYRRQIDASTDVSYLPATAKEDGSEPSWTKGKTSTHGLGFCPVVWFPHLRGCAVVNDFDGRAIHEHLTDEIRAHDFALSQRHRAALYAGDPQWTEIGVKPGYNPTGTARRAEVPASIAGRPGSATTGSYVSEPSGNNKARKKSPGTVWQYEGKNPEVSVQLHCLPGDALKAIDDHARDLRAKLAESLGVVFLDTESMPRESRISGRGLEIFKARQLDRVDYYREDFGDRFLLPALGMLLQIALKTNLKVPGLDVVKKVSSDAAEQWSWHAPTIDLIWGDYFKQNGDDEQLIIQGAVAAKQAGLATTRVLVEKLRSILGIRDVDSYMAELEKEQADDMAKQKDMMAAQAQAKAAAAPAPAAKPAQGKPQ